MALALALFCKVAIAKDQLEPGLRPSFRPAANNNRDIANRIAMTSKVDANKIRVVIISPLNNHINTKIVINDSKICSRLSASSSPKLRRNTRSGGISNKSNNGFRENISAQTSPIKLDNNQGRIPACGNSAPINLAR